MHHPDHKQDPVKKKTKKFIPQYTNKIENMKVNQIPKN